MTSPPTDPPAPPEVPPEAPPESSPGADTRLHGYLARFGFRGGDATELPAVRAARICGSAAAVDTSDAIIGAEHTALHATFTGKPGACARFRFELPAPDRRRRLDAVHLHAAAGVDVHIVAIEVERSGQRLATHRDLALTGPVALRLDVADKPAVDGPLTLIVSVRFGRGRLLRVHFESAGVDLLG